MALPGNSGFFDQTNNSYKPENQGAWSDLTSWSTWTSWANQPADYFIVTSDISDRGRVEYFNLITNTDVTGNIAYTVYTSNTGEFTGEETVTEITPNTGNLSAFYGRYYAVSANVSGGAGIELRNLNVTSSNDRFEIEFNDLNSADLTLDPLNSGNRLLPLTRIVGAVLNVHVTPHNPSLTSSIYVPVGNVGYVNDWYSNVSTVTSQQVSISPTFSQYIMAASNDTPYNYLFSTDDGLHWSALSTVSNTGGSYGESVDWSHDGSYVAFGLEGLSSNNLRIYSRSGDTFTQSDDPDSWPNGGVHDVCWTNTDNTYLAVGHDSTPYISLYKNTAGTFSIQDNPDINPTGRVSALAFDPTDSYLAVGHQTSPYITVYAKSGNTFTKLTNPSSLPSDTVYDVTWDPTGHWLFCTTGSGATASIKIYYRNSNTLIAISNPTTMPPSTTGVYTVDWNHSGNAVAIGWNGTTSRSDWFNVYRVNGNSITWANTVSTTDQCKGIYDIEWSSNDAQLYVAHHNTIPGGRGLTAYDFNYTSNVFVKLDNLSANVGNAYAVSTSPVTVNNRLYVQSVADFPNTGTLRVGLENMTYTTANVAGNRFEGVTRAATVTSFGSSLASTHPAGMSVELLDYVTFANYFEDQIAGSTFGYVGYKTRYAPSVAIKDYYGTSVNGVFDAKISVLPEQYMDGVNLGVR